MCIHIYIYICIATSVNIGKRDSLRHRLLETFVKTATCARIETHTNQTANVRLLYTCQGQFHI